MKPKREITLGEMHDECSFRGGNCQTISCATVGGDMCVHYKICGKIGKPIDWDLTDPPRFTEAQRELLKALWDIGARFLARDYINTGAFSERPHFDTDTYEWMVDGESANVWIFDNDVFNINEAEVLDLAEMFGKEKK